MATPSIVYSWQGLPEYRCAQQFARCVGRIMAGLPFRVQFMVGRALTRGALMIAQAIVGANADMPPGEELSESERDGFRAAALDAVSICRDMLSFLRSERIGDLADLLVGLDLLDRIEQGVRGESAADAS